MPNLTSKCQTTVPKEVRDHLRLRPGDSVRWFIHPDGLAYLLPEVPVTSLKGILKGRRKRLDPSEIKDAAAEGAAERSRRAARRK